MGGVSLQRAYGVRVLDGTWDERPSPHSEYGRTRRLVLIRRLVYIESRLRDLECGRCTKAELPIRESL